MRVLVTGASGFAGRWLVRELAAGGHDVVAAEGRADLDVTDAPAVSALVAGAGADAVAHLAGVAFAGDARRDPERAIAVNAGGTRNVVEAVAAAGGPVPVLVVSSAEVYGTPDPGDLPLSEDAPLAATQPYGRSKIAAERAAREGASNARVRLVIARPFNHTGPGQRPDFVVPALSRRIAAAAASGASSIGAGNVGVRRDIGDVRDVVRAYRLLLEAAAADPALADPPLIVNIATGRSVAIREIIDALARLAGIEIGIEIDPSLVRADDPPEIRGDASRLAALTGWAPTIPLEQTLRDVLAEQT
jgi:GDP-4-dehydro-6-deoxy-D-mannose reductase